jgi:probable F420-dependent oxidoreductase
MRPGITIIPEPFQNQHNLDYARRAEELGYVDAWSIESSSIDAFSPLAAAAAVTRKMRLGTAIVPVFTRPPALIAMSSATVQQISGGRFVLGLGLSTPTIVEQWMGVEYRKPVTRMRETVAALRQAFTRSKVVLDGKTVRINGFRLDMPLDTPPPIYIAAQGSKMLRIAGEIGDGLLVNFITPEALPAMLKHTHEGMRAAGRDPAQLDVVCRIIVVMDEDEARARAELKRSLTSYVTVPQYNRFFAEFGFRSEAETAIAAWQAGDRRKALESIPDRMVDSIFVIGTADYCRNRIQDYVAAGVTTTALLLTSLASSPEGRRARLLSALEKLAPR